MRALILSDIHGNLEALMAVLGAAPAHDEVWNLGDVVGYGGSPNEVVDCMRLLADSSVRGNHDKVCSGLVPAEAFNPVARQAVQWTAAVLTADSAEWLRRLPQGPLPLPAYASAIAHGSPTHEDQYIVNIRDAWEPLQRAGVRTTFFGHTHVQGGFQLLQRQWLAVRPQHNGSRGRSHWTMPLLHNGTRYLLNPGSVGQPRDGDWRAAFAVLDTESHEVHFYREPYDLHVAQGRILMAGLPERLAERLRDGR